MLVFSKRSCYFANMIFFLRRNNQTLSTAALTITYLAVCLLSLWFHQHPGEDHAEVNGDFYHSHASSFVSHSLTSEQDHHDLPEGLHLLEGSSLFDKMQASITAHFGQILIPGKYVSQIDFLISSFVENSPPNSVVNTVLKLPPIQTARDYFALTATGLSPPLA